MATLNKLSDTQLRAILGKPYKGKSVLSDGAGLSVRISKNGVIGWVYRYRLGGRETNPKWISLGSYPETSIKQARVKRDECRVWLDAGKDPQTEIKLTKAKLQEPVTVQKALEYWLTNHAEQNRTNVERHRAQFAKHVYPYLGKLPVEQVETHHWLECFERIRRGIPNKQRPAPVGVGLVFQNVKHALKFCRIRRYAISNALDDLTANDVGNKAQKKDRVLTPKELDDLLVYAADSKCPVYYSRLIWLLVIFGARTQEIRQSTWDEWDFDKEIWTVPKSNSKTNELIMRPIPKALKGWLLELKAQTQKSGFILGELKKPEAVSQWGGLRWKQLGHDKKWSLHDLRRTLATRLNDLGVLPHIVEHLLGHSVGGVAGIYNRSHYLTEKRVALDLWLETVSPSKEAVEKQG